MTSVTDGRHTHGVTDQEPQSPEAARVGSVDGAQVVSIHALIARLQQVTSRAEIEHVCDVLATLTGTPTPVDRQTALADWESTVVRHVLAHPQAPATAVDVEAARLEAVQDSQAGSVPWRASFTTPTAAETSRPAPGATARRHTIGKPQPPGMER